MEEDRVPSLSRIEEVNHKMSKEGIFFRDYDREYYKKNLDKLHMFLNQDLEDCLVPQDNLEMDCSLLNLRNDPNKFMVGSATKLAFGRLDASWTTQPATGENYMIPRRRFYQRRCMLFSLDALEDVEMKRREIERGLNEDQIGQLMDENSALNRLKEKGLDLTAYDPQEYHSHHNDELLLMHGQARQAWSVSEVCSLYDASVASRTHIRTVIEQGLNQTISVTDQLPFV